MSLGADRCLYPRSKAHNLLVACEHNGCVEALSSVRRDGDVATKCLLRSLVKKTKRNSLERALEAKERRRGRREGKVGRVIIVCCVPTLSSRNNARSQVEYRVNGTTLTYTNIGLHLSSTKDSTYDSTYDSTAYLIRTNMLLKYTADYLGFKSKVHTLNNHGQSQVITAL